MNQELLTKLIGMMFSDNDGERLNATSLFVSHLRTAGIHPQDVVVGTVPPDPLRALSKTITERTLQNELDILQLNLLEIIDQIECIRTKRKTDVSVQDIINQLESSSVAWPLFVTLCASVIDISPGWHLRLIDFINARKGTHHPITPAQIIGWRYGRVNPPEWVVTIIVVAI